MPNPAEARPGMDRVYVALVALGLLFVVLSGGLAYRDANVYRLERDLVRHTYAVLDALDLVQAALLDTQRLKRGFVISGDASTLARYRLSTIALRNALHDCRNLTRDNPEQQRTLDELQPTLADVSARFDAQIAVRLASGFDIQRESVFARAMERRIQRCRDLLLAMRDREERLLDVRAALADKRSDTFMTVLIFAIASSVGVLAFAAWISTTELRRRIFAEAALREQEQRLSLALHGGGLGTFDWDVPSGRLTFNERWAGMLGYTHGELKQHLSTWERLVHPDDLGKAYETLDLYLAGALPEYEMEMRLRARDGNWVWVLAVGKVISRDRNGAPLRMCGTHRDITDAKQKAQELEAFAVELERSNKELDEFAYIASHDLKEPLRGIRNYASFLLEDYEGRLDGEGEAKLRTLVKLSDRLETFIEDLLRYSRVGRERFILQPCDTGVMVRDVVEQLSPWLEVSAARVDVAADMPVVQCHPIYFAEVFKNLIANGVKYNDKTEKRIRVGCRRTDQGAPEFFVRDNGIGIPERHRENVFQIFKRLHGRDKYGGGSGAGLTITRKIVERHGGRIWIGPDDGEGCVFHFTLADGEMNG